MTRHVMLTVTSLVSAVLLTLHISQDIVFGFDRAGLNLVGVGIILVIVCEDAGRIEPHILQSDRREEGTRGAGRVAPRGSGGVAACFGCQGVTSGRALIGGVRRMAS